MRVFLPWWHCCGRTLSPDRCQGRCVQPPTEGGCPALPAKFKVGREQGRVTPSPGQVSRRHSHKPSAALPAATRTRPTASSGPQVLSEAATRHMLRKKSQEPRAAFPQVQGAPWGQRPALVSKGPGPLRLHRGLAMGPVLGERGTRCCADTKIQSLKSSFGDRRPKRPHPGKGKRLSLAEPRFSKGDMNHSLLQLTLLLSKREKKISHVAGRPHVEPAKLLGRGLGPRLFVRLKLEKLQPGPASALLQRSRWPQPEGRRAQRHLTKILWKSGPTG